MGKITLIHSKSIIICLFNYRKNEMWEKPQVFKYLKNVYYLYLFIFCKSSFHCNLYSLSVCSSKWFILTFCCPIFYCFTSASPRPSTVMYGKALWYVSQARPQEKLCFSQKTCDSLVPEEGKALSLSCNPAHDSLKVVCPL